MSWVPKTYQDLFSSCNDQVRRAVKSVLLTEDDDAVQQVWVRLIEARVLDHLLPLEADPIAYKRAFQLFMYRLVLNLRRGYQRAQMNERKAIRRHLKNLSQEAVSFPEPKVVPVAKPAPAPTFPPSFKMSPTKAAHAYRLKLKAERQTLRRA